MKIAQFSFCVITILVSECSCQEITYKNVTFFDNHMIITTTHQGRSLQEFLPDDPVESLTILGTIPVLYKDAIINVSNVRELHLYNNKIEQIHPEAFKNLVGVELLEMKYSDFITIKKGIFNDLAIRKLIVAYNHQLETVEEGAFDNPHIETLELTVSVIKTLPKNIFQKMAKLKTLDLTGNLLSSIPPEFLKLGLESVYFSYNRLTSIPGGVFTGHQTLQEVNLADNNVSLIDSSAFDHMLQLKSVNLAHNKLTTIDPEWFYNSSSVTRLNLHRNFFEDIPDEAFKNLHGEVEKIVLSECRVKNISCGAFKGIKMVRSLDLRMNEIEKWDAGFLTGLKEIRSLMLSANKIKCPDGDFNDVFKAEYTYVGLNPLDVDCLEKIEDWMKLESSKGHVVCTEESCFD
ncbi:hypothetical protein Zmor_016251 [Zophobas morio]|uniref:Uncharacterized protein n=1 Tax=Zophobas morio TaxID=2755281 RepID=A0AA38IQ66_9CUCU|nr:hypothetical protein Zmor_016251 [Zophobas morio]